MRNRIALALVAALLLAPLALAAAFVETEAQVRTANLDGGGAAYITAESGDDSTAYTDTPGASAQEVRPNGTDGTADTLLKVIVRHSTNDQTAQVEVGLWSRRSTGGAYRFLDIADVQTSTATIRTYTGGLYLPERPLYFPITGADKYEVRVTDVSGSGTVNISAHTVGADSKAAE
jgi:hypothetical protein